MNQYEYLKNTADACFDLFDRQGYASSGNNGPYGQLDTPVRNTCHFLIIYSFLYKRLGDARYLELANKLFDYLCVEQSKSVSGAIKCMETNDFDHLNGLIGQAWAIEALVYYYRCAKNQKALDVALSIFNSQKYDFERHLWHRIELDGTDIGYDVTYNHHIWFAACGAELMAVTNDGDIKHILSDFMDNGSQIDFQVHANGMLRHHMKRLSENELLTKTKRFVKNTISCLRWVDPQRFDYWYQEKGYHLFDMYGLCILEEHFPGHPLFSSQKFAKARDYALNIDSVNKSLGIDKVNPVHSSFLNIYGYPYNSPAFEFPYIAAHFGKNDSTLFDSLYKIQEYLMWDSASGDFTLNNPDIATFHARTYEIIRYLDLLETFK